MTTSHETPRVYDPRVGNDFRLRNHLSGKEFSSQAEGFYVVESPILEEWVKPVAPLKSLITETSRLGFFVATPWSPGGKKLMTAIREQLSEVLEFENSVCGYFANENGSLEKLLHLREVSGGRNSGEWGFGGCLERFTPPVRVSSTQAEAWDLFHILDQPEKIGCFVFLGEMAQATLLVRHFEGLGTALSTLGIPGLPH